MRSSCSKYQSGAYAGDPVLADDVEARDAGAAAACGRIGMGREALAEALAARLVAEVVLQAVEVAADDLPHGREDASAPARFPARRPDRVARAHFAREQLERHAGGARLGERLHEHERDVGARDGAAAPELGRDVDQARCPARP